MKRLSVIVPVFNMEPYLERCLRSLENQDIPKSSYEIICINDGSQDNSRGIVLKLIQEFDNILLIDQSNKGVSCARNEGIKKASGEYLLFIDADDYVFDNKFEGVLKNIDEQNAEVSFLSCSILNEEGIEIKRITYSEKYISQPFIGVEAYYIARGDGTVDPDRMTGVLFRKDFFEKYSLFYLPNVPYLEDGEFLSRILCLTKRCIFNKELFLYGTTRAGSASGSDNFHSSKATDGFILAVQNLKKFQQSQDLNDKQVIFLNQPIVKYALLAINSTIGWQTSKRLIKTIRILKRSDLRKVSVKGCQKDYSRLGKIYNISVYLCVLALIIFPRVKKLFRYFFK